MWRMQKVELQPGQIEQYRVIGADGIEMSYAQVLDHWGSTPAFSSFFSQQLGASAFNAFLWETPPLTHATLQRPFECVLINSPQLARAAPDSIAFAEHFESVDRKTIVRFENLGRDATLIAPCPLEPISACTHLAGFLRHAPDAVSVQLWRAVAEGVAEMLSEQPLWVSTCGLGVYWLHVRLDSLPKYYRFSPYQQENYHIR